MDAKLFGEFMGTLVLVLLGNGTVANVVLKKTLGENSGWPVIISGYGLGVMGGIFVAIACGSGDAYINPAVTLTFAIKSGNFENFLPYVVAQVLGAFTGAVLVWLQFRTHFAATPEAASKLACFSTGPAIQNKVANFISETLGTFVFMLSIGSIVKVGPAAGLVPLLIGLMVWAIGAGLGGTTGFAINPARDLGPRLAHAILPIPGKGDSNFSYGLMVPVGGGFLGAILAGLFMRVAGF